MRFGLIVSALLFVSPAVAADTPRSLDFTTTLTGLDGKPAMECKEAAADGKGCAKTGPITLGEISAAALSQPDRATTLIEQVRRGRLAQHVLDAKAAALTSEEITLIKDALPKLGLSTVLVANAVEMLDPASVPKN